MGILCALRCRSTSCRNMNRLLLLLCLLAVPCYGQRGFMAPALGLRNVVPGGLVGYWQMDEAGGNVVRDLSGNGNTGTFAVAPTWTNGVIGSGLFFSTTWSYITNSSLFNVGATNSASLWIKPKAQGGPFNFGPLIDFGGNNRCFAISGTDLSAIGLAFSSGGGGWGITFAPGTNQWNHVAYVRTGGTNFSFYINGVYAGIGVGSGTLDSAQFGGIGFRSGNTGMRYDGSLDNVRIYNRALSAEEVSKIYTAEKWTMPFPNVTDGLLAWWKFDGTVNDSSTNGNNLTLFSGTYTNGQINNALYFNGTSDYAYLAGFGNFTTQDFSFAWWLRQGSSGYGTLLFKGSYAARGYDVLTYGTTTNYGVYMRVNSPTSINYVAPSELPCNNTWNHIALVRSASTLYWYSNGVAWTSSTLTNNPKSSGEDFGIAVYSKYTTFGKFTMDDLRTYSRALSAAEVQTIYRWRP